MTDWFRGCGRSDRIRHGSRGGSRAGHRRVHRRPACPSRRHGDDEGHRARATGAHLVVHARGCGRRCCSVGHLRRAACTRGRAHRRQRRGRRRLASHLGAVLHEPAPAATRRGAARGRDWRPGGPESAQLAAASRRDLPMHDPGARAARAQRHDRSRRTAHSSRGLPPGLRRAGHRSSRSPPSHAVRGDRLRLGGVDDPGRLSLQDGEWPPATRQRLEHRRAASGSNGRGRRDRPRHHSRDELWPHHSEDRHRSPGEAVISSDDWLPPFLSVIAGIVEVMGYLTLGNLFTAHITGNLVTIAALLVRGGPLSLAQILAVPVFMVALAGMWLIAEATRRRGPALVRPLLLVHFLLLSGVLICSAISDPVAHPQGRVASFTAMIAVCAMACQFAVLRLGVPGAPSTAVMTGNLTNSVLSLLDTLSGKHPLTEGADERLKKTSKLVVGFFAGCVLGAAALSLMGPWAWSLPVVLAGAAVARPGTGVG